MSKFNAILPMTILNLAQEVMHIPRSISSQNNLSVYDLLKKTGYLGSNTQLSISDIRSALALEPACVDEWLTYSENKRCDSGWYLSYLQNGKYIVGYYPHGEKISVTFTDPLDGCADFIMKEIETIRLNK